MSPDLAWNNLANYCLQIGLLVGVAAFIPALLRLSVPRVRLAFWHILLAVCVLLPLAAPWRRDVPDTSAQVTTTMVGRAIPLRGSSHRPFPWNRIALGMLAAGVVIRLAWLGAGIWRLRHYRRRSLPLHPPVSWGVEADLRISDDVASPVTFGFLDPVVLLPANFADLDAPTREAVLCHEILHVRRKDWLVTLAEELVRSIFWFHPAIWWLLGEISLSREQAVDSEAVEMTRSREEYVDALLAIAGAKPRLDLAPAPLFLRKRHLKQRVVSILKEVRMSKTRSISALTAGLGILAAACWFVTMTFPLSAAPQTVDDGPGVTVDLGASAVMHRTGVMYPIEARRAKVEGSVTLEATLDSSGNVIDARVLSGPNELRRTALESILRWHFATDSGGNTRQVHINFQLPTAADQTSQFRPVPDEPLRSAAIAPMNRPAGAVAPGLQGRTLKQINIIGLSDDARSRVMSRLPVRVGDILAADSVERTMQAVHDYDEHLMVMVPRDGNGDASLIIAAPGASARSLTGTVAVSSTAPKPAVPGRITIGGNVQSAKLILQPRPMYPPLAKQARIQGTVRLAVVIAKDGTVQDIQVISGHPLLVPPALDAVRNWVYQPTLLNGEPVEISTQVDVNFTLSDVPPPQQQ